MGATTLIWMIRSWWCWFAQLVVLALAALSFTHLYFFLTQDGARPTVSGVLSWYSTQQLAVEHGIRISHKMPSYCKGVPPPPSCASVWLYLSFWIRFDIPGSAVPFIMSPWTTTHQPVLYSAISPSRLAQMAQVLFPLVPCFIYTSRRLNTYIPAR